MMGERQARFREDYKARIAPWYRGSLHALSIYAIGAAAFYVYTSHVAQPRWYEWLAIPPVVVFTSLFEWALHRYIMHRPRKPRLLRAIYRRHTLMHHQYFTQEEKTFDGLRELRIVLFPPYALVAFILMSIPLGLAVGALVGPNAGWFAIATTTGMYLVYEHFHFCCHVKENWFVRNIPCVNTIRRHHAAHHDQSLMMERNMNLTFPIADWMFGTSDLDRGLLGHLFNGYSVKHLKSALRQTAATPRVTRVQAAA